MSAEPSMEDILSSIKRIIAEEGEPGAAPRPRRPRGAATAPAEPLPAPRPAALPAADEVLELSEPMDEGEPPITVRPEPVRRPVAAAPVPPAAAPEPIVSPRAAEASRGALDHLSRLVVKPEPGGSDTLEGLVRELLRPMLREWLDANLPAIVEAMVEREVARIAGRQG